MCAKAFKYNMNHTVQQFHIYEMLYLYVVQSWVNTSARSVELVFLKYASVRWKIETHLELKMQYVRNCDFLKNEFTQPRWFTTQIEFLRTNYSPNTVLHSNNKIYYRICVPQNNHTVWLRAITPADGGTVYFYGNSTL